MNNWKVIFATAIIFGAGVLTGGLLVNYVQHSNPPPRKPAAARPPTSTNQPPRQAEVFKPRVPEMLTKNFLQQLDESLRLTTEQHDTIQKIMNEGQNQMRKTLQDARLEIREVLAPEQRQQFDELVKRPFHKPIFDTNAPPSFQERLKQILERQTNGLGAKELSPEAQVQAILLEAQRIKAMNAGAPPTVLPPTPLGPTNQVAP